MDDLFAWAERNQEPREAEILVLPMTRHKVVNELALKWWKQTDDERTDQGIRKDVVKILRKRLAMGVPDQIAARDAGNVYRSVWARIWSLRNSMQRTGA